MPQKVRVVGSYLSPYVRKVLVFLHAKAVAYEIDSIVPFYGDDRFSKVSPIRRIPVLLDDRVTLCDSSVICQYLEERYPEPALYPADIAERAQARWLEEFADTRMGEVFIWGLFNQLAIGPRVWGRKPDAAVLERTRGVDIPHVLDYLEAQLPADGFLFGRLSVADISIACVLRNAEFVRFRVDAERYPRTAGFVDRMFGLEVFARLRPIEERLLGVAPAAQWSALRDTEAPLTAETWGSETPHPGLMRIG